MVELKAGDIILTASGGVIGPAIRWFQRLSGEEKSEVNHTGIMVDGTHIVEALAKVYRRPLVEGYGKKGTLSIYRPLNLSEIDLDKVVVKAETYVGRTYGYVKIVAHAVDRLFGGAYVARRIARLDRYPICSWVVAKSYAAVGKDFGVPAGSAQPDDIWDFVNANPDKYECVFPLGKWA